MEKISCNTCGSEVAREVFGASGEYRPIQLDLQKWKWIVLLNNYYCDQCKSQALADAINSLADEVNYHTTLHNT
jgi:hypothetical protein